MIYGTPAASLHRGGFGTTYTRSAGAIGEYLTAGILNGFADRAAIFHDLAIPGWRGNIDHAVVAGNRVLLIDSKMWQAGRYWSVFGHHFRGTERVPAPSNNVAMAADRYTDRFPEARILTPLVVLWAGAQANNPYLGDRHGHPMMVAMHPERTARPFLHLGYPGGRAITGNRLYREVRGLTRFAGNPNPALVHRLTRYLNR